MLDWLLTGMFTPAKQACVEEECVEWVNKLYNPVTWLEAYKSILTPESITITVSMLFETSSWSQPLAAAFAMLQ